MPSVAAIYCIVGASHPPLHAYHPGKAPPFLTILRVNTITVLSNLSQEQGNTTSADPSVMPVAEQESARISPDPVGEKPVRERLQRASIDANAQQDIPEKESTLEPLVKVVESTHEDEAPKGQSNNHQPSGRDSSMQPPSTTRGRPQRKRSFDESESTVQQASRESRHGRKRSRESTLESEDKVTRSSSRKTSGESARPNAEGETQPPNMWSSGNWHPQLCERATTCWTVRHWLKQNAITSTGKVTSSSADADGAKQRYLEHHP